MPAKTRLPTPLSASVGLVVTAVEEARQAVRRAPQRAVRLPLQLVAGAMLWNERVRARYDELAERGERVVERLRSRGSRAAGRPAYGPAEGLADVRDLMVRPGRAPTGGTATAARNGVRDFVEYAADEVWDDDRELPGAARSAFDRVGEVPPPGDGRTGGWARPTPAGAAAGTDETGGTGPLTPTHVPEERVEPDVPVPGHDELPLPDFDHMTLGSLRGRLRRLDLAALEQLRAYEQAHARRLPILTMLENRIAKIGEPGGDASTSEAAGVPDETAGASPASGPPRSEPAEPRGDLPARDVPAEDGPIDTVRPPG